MATTYRWPSSRRLAALGGFIQPFVDAARHARLYYSCFLFGGGQRAKGEHAALKRRPRPPSRPTVRPRYLKGAAAASWRAEHVAFLPHALDVAYAVRHRREIHGARARGSRLLVLSLRK